MRGLIKLITATLLFIGCRHRGNHFEMEVSVNNKDSTHGYNYIFLSEGFQNDSVKVYIDSNLIYQSASKTDPRIGLAASIPYLRNDRRHHIIYLSVLKRPHPVSKEFLLDSSDISTVIDVTDSVLEIKSFKQQIHFR
jgi:hypothetical protein